MIPYTSYKTSGVNWIGEIPSHWEETKLKYIGFLYSGLSGKAGDDFKQIGNPSNKSFIPFTNIANNLKIDPDKLEQVVMKDNDNQNQVMKYDLFFMMSSENFDDVGKATILLDDLGEVYLNSFCKGFRITDKRVSPEYLNYLLLNDAYRRRMMIEANGFTRINLKMEKINDFLVSLPPLNEQTSIVNFLDEKTSQMDKLISNKQELIELLKEERTSIINEAVTKGIDSKVKSIPSGIEWLGDFPINWRKTKLKYITYLKGRVGWHGLKADEFNLDPNLPYCITGTDFKNGIIDWSICYHINEKRYEEDPYIQVKESDLLITKDGTIGKVALVKNLKSKAILNSGVFVMRPLKVSYEPLFMYWLIQSSVFTEFIKYTSKGSTIIHLYQDTFLNWVICLPEMIEQKKIVSYIETQIQKIDTTISKIEKEIELVQEYRIALISEVVVGKVKTT